MTWKNGGGLTHEIATQPDSQGPNPSEFAWRISLATISADGPFSQYKGYDRTIVLVDGMGMTLDLEDHGRAVIDRPHRPFRFSGDWSTTCALIDGPTRDLSVVSKRSLINHRVDVLRVGPKAARIDRDARQIFIFVFAGPVVAELGYQSTELGLHHGLRLARDDEDALPVRLRAPQGRGLCAVVGFLPARRI